MPTFYFDISPLGLALLVAGPLALQYLLGVWTGGAAYLVLASCYLSYVRAEKDLKEQKLANDIIANPNALKAVLDQKVLQRVLEHLPGYLRNPKMERCDWANEAAKAVFPYAASFIARKIKAKMNDKFQNMKGIAEIELVTLDPGDVSPVCTGVLVHEYQNDMKIHIEGDMVWNGKPRVEIRVMVGGQGFTIELYEVTMCAQLRLLVGPLAIAATPAKAMGVSFRRRPYINFGMRIGGVDMMNLGSGPAQVCKIVDRVIKRVIADMMIYPNNLWIQLDKTYDIKELSTRDLPCGLLSVHVMSAKNLVVADVTSSDPYVKLAVGTEERTTRTIKRNLNPVWDEKHIMIVYKMDMQVLELNCFDADVIGSDDPLGRATIPIGELEFYRREQRNVELEGVPHGSVQLDLMYIPLDAVHRATDQSSAGSGGSVVSPTRPRSPTSPTSPKGSAKGRAEGGSKEKGAVNGAAGSDTSEVPEVHPLARQFLRSFSDSGWTELDEDGDEADDIVDDGSQLSLDTTGTGTGTGTDGRAIGRRNSIGDARSPRFRWAGLGGKMTHREGKSGSKSGGGGAGAGVGVPDGVASLGFLRKDGRQDDVDSVPSSPRSPKQLERSQSYGTGSAGKLRVSLGSNSGDALDLVMEGQGQEDHGVHNRRTHVVKSGGGSAGVLRAMGRMVQLGRKVKAQRNPSTFVGYGVIVFEAISCSNLSAKDMLCEPFVQFKLKSAREARGYADLRGGDVDGGSGRGGAGTAAGGGGDRDEDEDGVDGAASAAGRKCVTEIAHGTNSPFFSRTVTFIISSDQKNQFLAIKVKDHAQKDKVLGEAQLRVRDVISAGEMCRELKICPEREESAVRFRAIWCKASSLPRVRLPPPIPVPQD